MCGIAGIIGAGAQKTNVDAVLQTLEHRGPDGQGSFSEENILLLHTRLAIVDTSENAAQPMLSDDERFVLLYNGEIYNHLSLRGLLAPKNVFFRSSSDSETLLHLLIHFSQEILPELNGMFAFAFYDKQKQELLLARDSFGMKPLYWQANADSFCFASELKTLLQFPNRDKAQAPEQMLQAIQLLYLCGENTGFKHIKKLLPGHLISLRLREPQTARSVKWKPELYTGKYSTAPEQELLSQLDTILKSAVERHLQADRPTGFFLSGGVDSSLVCAIARQHFKRDVDMHCFTAATGKAFADEGFGDDAHYARLLKKQFNFQLHEVPAPEDWLSVWDELILTQEAPHADPSAFFVAAIAQNARAMGIPVLLGGAAADDIFSGYRRHQFLAYEQKFDTLPAFAQQLISGAATVLPQTGRGRQLKKMIRLLQLPKTERMFALFDAVPKHTAASFFTQDFSREARKHAPEAYFENCLSNIREEKNRLNQMLYLETCGFLPDLNLNYTDKCGMVCGVEIRIPFLDKALTEFAAALPPTLKCNGSQAKYLLKNLAAKYLPKEIVHRRKTGFGAPLRQLMQHDLAFQSGVAARLNALCSAHPEVFDKRKIEQFWHATKSGKIDGAYGIMALISVESWLRQFAV